MAPTIHAAAPFLAEALFPSSSRLSSKNSVADSQRRHLRDRHFGIPGAEFLHIPRAHRRAEGDQRVLFEEDPWAESSSSSSLRLFHGNGAARASIAEAPTLVNGSQVLPGRSLENSYVVQVPALHDSSPSEVRALHVSRVPTFGEEDPFLAALQLSDQKVFGEEDPFIAVAELEAFRDFSSKGEDDQASVSSETTTKWPDFRFFPKRKVFPREEPWLLESIFLSESQEVPEARDVAVEIFINSSECTMQRIAIVENKKLVQLLLEPVNSNFQVGNVYLGVVKQLLPGMNGIFVEIGSSRTALLEVNMHQYPHVFYGDKAQGNEEDGLRNKDGIVIDVNEEEIEETVDDPNGEEMEQSDGKTNVKPATVLRKIGAWRKVKRGTLMVVQVKKEALRQKGPQLTATVALAGRYWVLVPQVSTIGVTRKINGLERSRLKQLARELQPPGFGLTVRTEAVGRSREELEKDLARLMETWRSILERAEVAAAAGGKDPVPVLLQRAMGQTLRTVRDLFNNEVERFVVDSSQTYQEVTAYLQEIAPHLCDRVELYSGKEPIFEAFNLEAEIEKSSSKRVELPNGAYLVLEETEALVSIDVNGGVGMLGDATSQREAVLEVNLAAARKIATELRLRDIGGIIVVDFIDMEDPSHERLVFEEMRKAIERDRSKVVISEISEFGLMEMTRARDRPSVTSRVTDSCSCCGGTGRIESVEMALSKIERAVKKILANRKNSFSKSTRWPSMALRVDPVMHDYLKTRGRRRMNQLCSALNVLLTLKISTELSRGEFHVTNEYVAKDKLSNGARKNSSFVK
ncbi:ribonuclease E/G-like protein, chloroplastic [Selaginella moellendorffii]|uniref:ribonuclease E/G-like protein, chloroplastic n=1 Tax=Selaginella moellendorffii TaxID=88036 RepID=UPI000D1C659B|nr:ribonuclease E/G-like protein, chloroplastic [Selaginella moellendorffii]|eukprot:XP_002969564.2 ribonuclease E/G-like protein, chloroplastic [Selaginella moellendorffii]